VTRIAQDRQPGRMKSPSEDFKTRLSSGICMFGRSRRASNQARNGKAEEAFATERYDR